MNCFINHFPLYAVRHPPVKTAFDPAFAGHFLISEFKEKVGKFGCGQGKRVYFCCLISWEKGTFLKLSDKHGFQ